MKKFYTWILLLVAFLMGTSLTGRAQTTDVSNKFSASTLMFLDERDGNIELPKLHEKRTLTAQLQALPGVDKNLSTRVRKRTIAETEMVGGVKMISAFVGVSDNNFAALESLGVQIEAKFDKLATTLIPVDKIEEVAALSNVTKIEVAEILEPQTDRARTVTQAIDAMTNSTAAKALGLTSPYTGKGVILGIIDTGIDFQHIAFKDKSGNSRIVRAYKLSGTNSTSLTTYSSASQISGLTYDTNDGDHGTHTSTTAGGSSVVVNGTTVTVTDDHANATYGGMAPEADLVIAGLSSLYTTSIGTAIQNICNYADQVGKPCVVSLSLGSQVGPHDGTGSIASIVNQYAGNNHIIVYAASNDGMRSAPFVEMGTSNGGGMYASATSTSSKPMIVNVQRSFSNADGNVEMLMPTIIAYARTAGVPTSLKFHVVNVKTGAIVYSSSAYSSSTTISVTGTTGLAQYFKSSSSYNNQYGDAGAIRLIRTQDTNNSKYYWQIYCPIMLSTSYSDSDGDDVYNSDYAFCVSVYPTSTTASTVIDMWENYASWFGTDLNITGNYTYAKGNDECSVSDNATYSKVISVGAYVTKNSITDYSGTTHDWSSEYPNIGDHASFSSWQTAGYGPLGTALPHINAPGARIVAGVNHYHTTSVDDYSYYGDDYSTDLVVNSTTYPYAAMEGTSMATPCVSGIIAQWLQACVEAGKTPTPDYIKEVMAATWDTDQWTNGTGSGAHGAKTFGTHGKINAIKGLQYILGTNADPTITADPTSVTFTNAYATKAYTQTINVTGVNLTGNIAVAKSGSSVFTVDKTSVTQSGGNASATITVTYKPTAAGTQTGTLTLTSAGAETVTVALSGTAKAATPTVSVVVDNDEENPIQSEATLTFSAMTNETASKTFNVKGIFLTGNITATLTDANGVFSVNPGSVSATAAESGVDVTVSFTSATEGNFTGTVVLTSASSNTVTLHLTATAQDGGKASDAWLDIAKYATIDDAGWNTSYVNNLYKYTEYADSECAWLTLPVYGGFVGVYYNSHPQAWIESSLGTSNTYGGTTWTNTASATNPFQGSSAYFTTATARAIGYNSRTNTAVRTVSFYVTNTTEVRLNGTGRSGVSATYPASLRVYECTKNANGTVTASTTATVNQTSTSTTTFTLSGTGLDATKIYKVECSIYRGYLYEVAFKTPITVNPELTVSPTSLSFSTMVGTPAQQTFTLTGKGLTGNVTATVSGEGFTVSPTSMTAAQAKAGQTLTVTYNPSARGSHTGTVTLSSAGATSVSVALTGEAMPAYFDLTVSKYGLSTMYLDFPVTIPYDDFEDLLGVYTVKSIVNGELRLARLNRNIPANTGVIVQANSGTYRFPTNTGTVTALTYENQLQGVVENTPKNDILATAPAGTSIYTLGLGPSGYVGFYRFSGATVRANSAYILYDESAAGVKGLTVVFEDGTTAIQPTRVEEEGDGAWYTVQGARLGGSPKTRGVYIHNGKKVLVK
ncbi:MAG: S8 family serine peptidase [Bacteroidaceae bacterium]|nr:S8 family serine peptidase [Bacteroidaceae bacterium]